MGHSLSNKILFDVQVAEMQDKSHKWSYGLKVKVQATSDCWLGMWIWVLRGEIKSPFDWVRRLIMMKTPSVKLRSRFNYL